jgi:hypothetical protein
MASVNGDAAEQHRAVRRRADDGDRPQPLAPVQALLPIAREPEQRVIDPEREPHPGEHVGGEHRQRERLPDERQQRERDRDRDNRHHQRDEPGHQRAEDDQHD